MSERFDILALWEGVRGVGVGGELTPAQRARLLEAAEPEQRKITRGARKGQTGWYVGKKLMPADWRPGGGRKAGPAKAAGAPGEARPARPRRGPRRPRNLADIRLRGADPLQPNTENQRRWFAQEPEREHYGTTRAWAAGLRRKIDALPAYYRGRDRDYTAILAALSDDPYDDAARAAMNDWLEERGLNRFKLPERPAPGRPGTWNRAKPAAAGGREGFLDRVRERFPRVRGGIRQGLRGYGPAVYLPVGESSTRQGAEDEPSVGVSTTYHPGDGRSYVAIWPRGDAEDSLTEANFEGTLGDLLDEFASDGTPVALQRDGPARRKPRPSDASGREGINDWLDRRGTELYGDLFEHTLRRAGWKPAGEPFVADGMRRAQIWRPPADPEAERKEAAAEEGRRRNSMWGRARRFFGFGESVSRVRGIGPGGSLTPAQKSRLLEMRRRGA